MLNLFNKKKKNTTIYSVTEKHDQDTLSTNVNPVKKKRAFNDENMSEHDRIVEAKNNVKKITDEVEKQIANEVTKTKNALVDESYEINEPDVIIDLESPITNLSSNQESDLNDEKKIEDIKVENITEHDYNNDLPEINAVQTNSLPKGAEKTPLNPESIISLKNLTLRLGDDDEVILNNLNLNINRGEFVFIIGPSGAGKTTLMNALNAQFRKYEGEILIDGDDLRKIKRRNIYKIRRKLGYIFQDFKLLESKNAFENIALGIEVLGQKNMDTNVKVLDLLELVGLEDREEDTIDELSGGEKQRLSIARALASDPPIVLADEPTGNLDDATGWKIVEVLTKLNDSGTTVIFGTHNKEIVNTLKKRVIHIENGSIVSDKKEAVYE